MIVIRSPLRIPFGGSGTDVAEYYESHKGFFISAAINKYIYIIVQERKFYDSYLIRYSKVEDVIDCKDIQHALVRQSIKKVKISDKIEVTSVADVPAGFGMGNSGAFIVSLLQALHTYKRDFIGLQTLAEEATSVRNEVLKENCGIQDQYVSAFGGIRQYSVNKKGSVIVSSLNISDETLSDLERNCHIFYTNQQLITEQKEHTNTKRAEEMKKIAFDIKKALESGNVRRFAQWLNVEWENEMNYGFFNQVAQKIYSSALKNGAIGGKLVYDQKGGFFLLYADSNHKQLKDAMKALGLIDVPFRFDFEGTKVIFNS